MDHETKIRVKAAFGTLGILAVVVGFIWLLCVFPEIIAIIVAVAVLFVLIRSLYLGLINTFDKFTK